MFWFDKSDQRAMFIDERRVTVETDNRKGRAPTVVDPDIVADFRSLPFPNDSFHLVVFDPPHLLEISEKSRLAIKYGRLLPDWKDEIREGFAECFRVLKTNGTLVFKWSEAHIPVKDVLSLTDQIPLFGNKPIGISKCLPKQSTHWIVFLKQNV
ncbi:MAG: SAM-dependent methyltransferase [Verrucomicrobiales bacterium]|jgi:SAM-dependent methyltransferase